MSYTYKLSPKRANAEVKVNAVWGTITGNVSDQQDLKSELDSIMDSIPDTSNLATKDELDTKANKTEVYTKSEIDNKGFLTEHQSLEDYALKTDIPDISNLAAKDEVAFKNDVYTKTEVDEKISSGGSFDSSLYYDKTSVDTLLDDKANISDIPTNTSQLVNDSGFITEIPSEYITETELSSSLNSKADSSSVYTKTEIDNMIGTISSTLDTLNGEVV